MVIGPNNVVILLPFTSDSTDGVTIAKKNIISVENYHTPVTSDILGELWVLVALPKIVWLTLQNILQQNPNETRALLYVEFWMHSGDYQSLSRKSRERIFKRKYICLWFKSNLLKPDTCTWTTMFLFGYYSSRILQIFGSCRTLSSIGKEERIFVPHRKMVRVTPSSLDGAKNVKLYFFGELM